MYTCIMDTCTMDTCIMGTYIMDTCIMDTCIMDTWKFHCEGEREKSLLGSVWLAEGYDLSSAVIALRFFSFWLEASNILHRF